MPRKPYQYRKELTTGEEQVMEIKEWLSIDYYGRIREEAKMCPYTNYIPLMYILSNHMPSVPEDLAQWCRGQWGVKPLNPNKMKKLNNERQDDLMTSFIRWDGGPNTRKNSKETTEKNIQYWLEEEGAFCVNSEEQLEYTRERERIVETIENNDNCKFYQPSYRGLIAPYSLFMLGATSYVPHVLATVLPENYLYVKHRLLLHNTIPLDRIVVLVDRNLDNPSFHSQPFRKLYREAMLPKLLKSKCDVWKVPLSFIQENCFIDRYRLTATNVIERERETEQLIEDFYAYCRQQTPTPAPQSTGVEGIYERLRETVPTYTTGSLGLGTTTTRNPFAIAEDALAPIAREGQIMYTNNLVVEDTDRWTWELPTGFTVGADPYTVTGTNIFYNPEEAQGEYSSDVQRLPPVTDEQESAIEISPEARAMAERWAEEALEAYDLEEEFQF